MPMPPLSEISTRLLADGEAAWAIHMEGKRRIAKGDKIYLLSIGEDQKDRATDQTCHSAIKAIEAGRHHYTYGAGQPELREAIAKHHTRTTGQVVTPQQCMVTAGAQNGLFAASTIILSAGDEVILCEPCYTTYGPTFSVGGAKTVLVHAGPETGFVPKLADLAAAVGPKTRAIVINSPNNPSGAVYPATLLEGIADLCLAHNLWLISDEVYKALVFEDEVPSPAGIARIQDRVVTISSLSKSHAMSGWRLGWAVGPLGLMEKMTALTNCMLYGQPPFIQDAALTALADEEKVTQTREGYRRRRDLALSILSKSNHITATRPKAGMFTLVDVTGTGVDAQTFAKSLIDEEDVAVLPATAFGPSYGSFLRVGYVVPDDELVEACKRIVRHAEKLAGRT